MSRARLAVRGEPPTNRSHEGEGAIRAGSVPISLTFVNESERPSERVLTRWRSLTTDAHKPYDQNAVSILEKGQTQNAIAYLREVEQFLAILDAFSLEERKMPSS